MRELPAVRSDTFGELLPIFAHGPVVKAMASTPLTVKLGEFVAGLDQLPPEVRERAGTCLLYNVGVSYGMGDRKTWSATAELAMNIYGELPSGGASLLASGKQSSLAGAAFANAVVFGAIGRADTIGTIHVSNVILSAVLAIAERRSLGADEIFPALVAGYEVGARLDRAYAAEAAKHGFRSTALFGSIAAAAACARLVGLDAEQASSAIAQAASMTGGLLQPFSDGSEEPRYQPGYAAALGLSCALAAERGVKGSYRALDGALGLVRASTGRESIDGELDHDLGSAWLINEVTFKPFPVCYYAQSAVYAGVAAHQRLSGAVVKSLTVKLSPQAAGYAGLDFVGPFNSVVAAMMSAPFAVAHGLVTGNKMSLPAVQALGKDPDIAAVLATTKVVGDPQLPALSVVLEITTSEGKILIHEQKMTEQDYCFDRDAVREMLRETVSGLGDPRDSQKRIDQFDNGVDEVTPNDFLKLFLE